MSASRESGRMLAACIMVGVPDMASSIARFVPAESVEGVLATGWQGTAIAVMRIVAIVYVAIETVGSVEPGSGTDEDAAVESIRSVVAIGRAVIRRVVEIAIGTVRLGTNVDADADLSRCVGAAYTEKAQQSEQQKGLD